MYTTNVLRSKVVDIWQFHSPFSPPHGALISLRRQPSSLSGVLFLQLTLSTKPSYSRLLCVLLAKAIPKRRDYPSQQESRLRWRETAPK